jgi:DNA-binding CsgD family transcriptional regulator
MTVAESAGPFVGRAAEVEAMRAELAIVRTGVSRLLVVQGDAGIGKTAMIDHVLSGEPDLTVLRATGEPWEEFVAYGVVDQLMRVAGVNTARLMSSRDRSAPPEEPVGVGGWILDVIKELVQKAPLAVVVDDAHWADMDSLRALLFAVRRLVDERVLVVLGQRTEDQHRLPEGLRRMAGGHTGSTLTLEPLPAADVQQLASALGVRGFSGRAAQRLQAHTGGNALYVKTMLTELPEQRWRNWDLSLPAPRAFAAQVMRRLEACSAPTRGLVEAVAVLGNTASVAAAGTLADVPDLVAALDEASVIGLLQVREDFGIREVGFPHPLVQAAVYEQLGPLRRVRLHAAAAEFVDEEGALLRHRVLAATPPDPALAAELEAFARREAAVGAWASAAWALVEGSSLSPDRAQREQRLLRAVDATIGAGDLLQAEAFARDVASFSRGAWRDAALGYLAVLRGRQAEAEELLQHAWRLSAEDEDSSVAAVVAQRLALHAIGRLRGADIVYWSRKAIELARPGDPVRVEAEAVIGLGMGWEGQIAEGMAAYESLLGRVDAAEDGPQLERIRMAHGWLRLVRGDVVGARASLAMTAPAALRAGSVRIAVWSFAWLAHAAFAVGDWDAAASDAERAVSLLDESGMEWLRPLARYAAVLVPAARGEWDAAEEQLSQGTARPGDYELMVVAAALARVEVAAARGDHDGVLRALEPVLAIESRVGVDEPGFWPWQDRYADALISAGRVAEAEELLAPHEELAAARGRGSMIARLARVRGRLEAAGGRMPEAERAFEAALAALDTLSLPFERAQVELAYGQALRRGGQRRAAAAQLQAARDRFAALAATPFLERCDRELRGCGLAPAKRSEFDPAKLTAQEQAVARLVAVGMSNRQVAGELFVSVKTVQFHLTHIYAKLGIGSRAELAAQFRE